MPEKQAQFNKNISCKNNKRLDYYYNVGDKVMLDNKCAYKYETPWIGLFDSNAPRNNTNMISYYINHYSVYV